MNANNQQIAGDHYKILDPEPWDVILKWKLGYLDGTALKYISRWRNKNGVEDLKKAVHFLQKAIEEEEKKENLHASIKPNFTTGVNSVWDYADRFSMEAPSKMVTSTQFIIPSDNVYRTTLLNQSDRRYGDEPF